MPNQLINEQSLYLQQHAHNPVAWFPWGEEAFEKAKRENKPVLVSIGYAACHWCHVMERESFEDESTAAFMNEHFVNIKVDREEHPDVDHLYMDAVQAISGQGGWPLNVFVTPDKIPFFGGTYFPPKPYYNRPSWREVLQRMHEIWTRQPEEISRQKEQMISFLNNMADMRFHPLQEKWNLQSINEIATQLLKQADVENGGFGNAPKFPQTMSVRFLLEHYRYTKNTQSLQHALLCLDKMCQGGIYDQIGGGFARYSTDSCWLAPHFEKMLYDNALLISLYATAFITTKNERYKIIVEETAAFVARELKDASELYYCALDADSEGEEGKYYTWTWEEWNELFKKDAMLLATYFGVEEKGNWEHTNILHVACDIDELSKTTNFEKAVVLEKIKQAQQLLLAQRAQRIRPATDDKCLLSWNALMNVALTDAYLALQDEKYLERAETHMAQMLQGFEKENKLYRVYKNGKARIDATLEDYAFMIEALVKFASASSNDSYLLKAKNYCDDAVRFFSQKESVLFYYSSTQTEKIPIKKIDIYDGALPAANAVMAGNLALLGMLYGQYDWMERSAQMLEQLFPALSKHPLSFSHWATLLQRHAHGLRSVIFCGKNAPQLSLEMQQRQLFHCYIFGLVHAVDKIPLLRDKNLSDETHIFVCTQETCLAPVTTLDKAIENCERC